LLREDGVSQRWWHFLTAEKGTGAPNIEVRREKRSFITKKGAQENEFCRLVKRGRYWEVVAEARFGGGSGGAVWDAKDF